MFFIFQFKEILLRLLKFFIPLNYSHPLSLLMNFKLFLFKVKHFLHNFSIFIFTIQFNFFLIHLVPK
jgi:hypothetical protein